MRRFVQCSRLGQLKERGCLMYDITVYASSVHVGRSRGGRFVMVDLLSVDFEELSSTVLDKIPDEDLLARVGKKKCLEYWEGRDEE